MGALYTAGFENVTFETAVTTQDIFSLQPSTAGVIALHSIYLQQLSITGDYGEEMVRWQIICDYTSRGTGGQSMAARKLHPDTLNAAVIAWERANSTLASGGTPREVHSGCFNNRGGLIYVATPQRRIIVKNPLWLVVRQLTKLSQDMDFSGQICWELLD